MNSKHYDQVPVLNEKGGLVGVATMNDMAMKLATGKITVKSPVSAALYADFKKVKKSTNLWTVSKMFEKEKFILVTSNDANYDLYGEDGELTTISKENSGEGSLCGIISSSDFFKFLTTYE